MQDDKVQLLQHCQYNRRTQYQAQHSRRFWGLSHAPVTPVMRYWQVTQSPVTRFLVSNALARPVGFPGSQLLSGCGGDARMMPGCVTPLGRPGARLRLLVHQLSTNLSFPRARDGWAPRLCPASSFTRLLHSSARFSCKSSGSCSSITPQKHQPGTKEQFVSQTGQYHLSTLQYKIPLLQLCRRGVNPLGDVSNASLISFASSCTWVQ